MDTKSKLILARTQYNSWMIKYTNAVFNRNIDILQDFRNHSDCDFGKWYYGNGKEMFKGNATFHSLEKPHKQLHETGRKIISTLESGQTEIAKEWLVAFENQSEKMNRILTELIEEI